MLYTTLNKKKLIKKKQSEKIAETRGFQTKQVCTMMYMYISHSDLGLLGVASFTSDPAKAKCVYFVNKLLTALV